jgi:hypothetical protein
LPPKSFENTSATKADAAVGNFARGYQVWFFRPGPPAAISRINSSSVSVELSLIILLILNELDSFTVSQPGNGNLFGK